MAEQLVLEWGRDRIRVLEVEPRGRQFALRHAAEKELTHHVDPSTPATVVGDELRRWLESLGIAPRPATVVLPREAVVIRRLQLPGAPEDELPDLVRFQAATKSAAVIDQLVLDFLVIPGSDPAQGIPVVTFSLDRDKLARLTAVLGAAGIEVSAVTISSLTVARLMRHVGHPELGSPRPELVVLQSGDRLELGVFDHGTLVLAHGTQTSTPSGAERVRVLKSELTRLLVTLSQSKPDAEIGKCVLVSGNPDPEVVAFLQERFAGAFEPLNLAASVAQGEISGFETMLGVCAADHDGRLHIDFVSPRKRREVPDRRKLYWGVGTVLGLLLLASGYFIFQLKKAALETGIAALVERDIDLDKQLKAGEPRTKAHGRVAAWDSKRVDPLAVWSTLRSQLPGTDRVYFSMLKIIPQKGDAVASFSGKGHARQRRDVEELHQKLAENGFRVTPKPTTTGTGDPDYPIQFDLDVLLLRPSDKKTPPAVAASKPRT